MANPTTTYFGPTGDQLIDGITNGYKWNLDSSKTVDFSISNGYFGEFWYQPDTVASYMEIALLSFSYYADIKFNYVGYFSNPTSAANAGSEINLSMDGYGLFFSNSSTWAIGFFPNSAYHALYYGAPGDLYLNLNSPANSLPSYEPGSQGWFLLIHELGHALGLKHPHDDGGTGRPTFNQLGLGFLDTDLATIMSYNDDGQWNNFNWDPATPMLLDVLGLMYLYGKNTQAYSGNSSFELKETGYYYSIWDSSGLDTLNASTALGGWVIDMPNISLTQYVDVNVGFAFPIQDLGLSIPTTLQWLLGDYENVIGSNFYDIINGNNFDNEINGGAGNDTITGGAGNDTIIGGAGADTVSFTLARSSYNIALASNIYTITALSGTDGIDRMTSVEFLQFSDQTINISSLDLVAPTISIITSDLSLTVGETALITFTLSEASTDFAVGDVTVSGGTLSGFSGSGTSYTATFTPTANSTTNGVISAASNTFRDAAGNYNTDGSDSDNRVTMTVNTVPVDSTPPTISIISSDSNLTVGETALITFTLSEASTDFAVGDVTVSGGTLSGFSGSGTSYTATFTPTANSTTNGVISAASNTFRDAAGNFNADGSDSDNRVTMSVNTVVNLTLAGDNIANTLTGGLGNDTITGGGGIDILNGGDGSDLYIMTLTADHTAAEINDTGVNGTDEVRFTSATASTLTLFAGDRGIETVVIGTGTGASAITTGTTANNINAAAVLNALSITGNNGNNTLTGTAYADTLIGNAGNDTLIGGAGADTMVGGTGNDTYVVDNLGDTVTEFNGEGTDTIQLALSSNVYVPYVLADFVENLTFTGSGYIALFGNGLANTITGSAGNDFINGGEGADTMIGGAGSDNYYVDNIGDVVTEATNGGTGDFVYSYLTTYTLGANVEHLGWDFVNVGATSSNLTFTGNALQNLIFTSDGNDTITGLGGVDTLYGGHGSDLYIMTLASDHTAAEIYDGGDSGTDEVRFTSTTAGTLTLYAGDIGIETVVIGTGTGASAITTGTTANNVNAALVTNALSITGNNGNNILTGTAYADTLIGNLGNDTLSGGGGNDSLNGGVGLDTFNVTAGTDTVADLGQGGVDILNVSAGATANATIHTAWTASRTTVNRGTANITTSGLAVNLAAVTTAGTNGFNVTNTGSATTLTGSGLIDTLVGGTGNDTLIGNAGNDTLTGNAGDDILNGGVGIDRMDGGEGSDIYLIGLLAEYATGEVIADTGSTGTDELRFATTAASTLTLANTLAGIENIVIGTGTAASAISTATTAINVNASALTYGVSMTGNNGANILTGTGFADTLTGNLGNDTLIGGGGNDRLIGGVGADRLTGGLGSDTFVFTTGDTGITATTIDTIQDYAKGNVGTGDLIDYSSNLTIGGSATTATATSASINQTTGVATFAAGSGTTLADALADIATNFNAADNSPGDFAFFRVNNTGNFYMFISDGTAGLGANDVVIQLVGITSINGIDLNSGDLTIVS